MPLSDGYTSHNPITNTSDIKNLVSKGKITVITLWPITPSADQGRPGGRGGGGSGIPVYPKKIRQNTQKYPKLMEALYTVYLKFKESDIPNTRI